jgi:hypothetical protein
MNGERQRRADIVYITRVAIQNYHQLSIPSAVRSCSPIFRKRGLQLLDFFRFPLG